MSTADAAPHSASALRLVVTAERLFAQHGIAGVSLRQVAGEAGSANNSAVHYHFGSKQGLIGAIFQYRLPQLLSERRLLTARCDPDDLRSRLEAHFLPVFGLAESPDNHYVSFVEQLQRHALASEDEMLDLPEEGQRANDEFRRDLHRLLGEVPEPLRELRIVEALSLCLHAAADRERSITSRPPSVPFELFAGSILDGVTAFLSAPPSDTTLRWANDTDIEGQSSLRLL